MSERNGKHDRREEWCEEALRGASKRIPTFHEGDEICREEWEEAQRGVETLPPSSLLFARKG
jgi:hypothetical protein